MAQPLLLPPGYIPKYPPPGYPLLPLPPLHPDPATQQGYAPAQPYPLMLPQGYGQWPLYQGWPYAPYAPASLPPNEIRRPHTAAPADPNTLTPVRTRSVRAMPASALPTLRQHVNSQRKPEGE